MIHFPHLKANFVHLSAFISLNRAALHLCATVLGRCVEKPFAFMGISALTSIIKILARVRAAIN